MKNKQKLTNIRSGGIILAIRDDIATHVKIINTDGKYVLWFTLEKLLFNSKEDVFCYLFMFIILLIIIMFIVMGVQPSALNFTK